MVEWFPITREQLENRLRRFVYVRASLVTAVLLICWVLQGEDRAFLQVKPWYLHVVFIAAYILSLLQLAGIRRKPYPSSTLIGFQIFIDIGVVTGIVHFTGSLESPFTVLYVALILSASVFLTQTAMWMSVVFSSLSIALLSFLGYRGWLQEISALGGIPSSVGMLDPTEFWSQLGMIVLSMYVAAFLGGYLSKGLRLQREMLDSLFQDLRTGLIVADRAGQVIFMNQASERMLERSFPDVVGRPIRELLPTSGADPDAGFSLERDALQGGEIRLTCQDGDRILELTTSRIEGHGQRLIALLEDVTRVRALEETVNLKEKLATVGESAAGIAHEIRNPLASIRGSAKALTSDPRLDQDSRRLADLIVRESDRLASVVTSFLNFAKMAPPQLKEVSIWAFLSEFLEGQDRSGLPMPSPSVSLKGVDQDLALRMDPDQMRMALSNLVQNAGEAGAKTVAIEARPRRDPRFPGMMMVEILVSDDGRGVPADIQGKIFNPFFTTRTSGTGMGLALVQRIVAAHGGHVLVRSEEGQGATFVIRLTREDRKGEP